MIESMLRQFGQEVIVTRKQSSGSGAYPTITYAEAFRRTGVVDALSGTKNARYGKVVEESTHMLYMLPCELRKGDRVTCAGKTYDVMFVDNPMHAGRFVQAEVELLP